MGAGPEVAPPSRGSARTSGIPRAAAEALLGVGFMAEARTWLLPARNCWKVSDAVLPWLVRTPSSKPGLRGVCSLGPQDLGTGEERVGYCVHTGVLSLTLTRPVSVSGVRS